jgi:hypothetical protein
LFQQLAGGEETLTHEAPVRLIQGSNLGFTVFTYDAKQPIIARVLIIQKIGTVTCDYHLGRVSRRTQRVSQNARSTRMNGHFRLLNAYQ